VINWKVWGGNRTWRGGSQCGRAEDHVLGLALLNAALAEWDYATRSMTCALGTTNGDPDRGTVPRRVLVL
jgi:hypothetical protein